MVWIPNPKEIQNVQSLEASKRYEYLIKKIVDQEVVWSLWGGGGWALAAAPSGLEAVPIWPHEEYARACATDTWLDFQPKEVLLEVWLNKWIHGMEKDNRLVAVFPTPADKGIFLNPAHLGKDLKIEMENYK